MKEKIENDNRVTIKELSNVILKVFLGTIMFFAIMGAVGYILIYVESNGKGVIDIKNIYTSFSLIGYAFILYNLLRIICSIDTNPFCIENVKRLNMIGICMIFITIFDGIINFKQPIKSGWNFLTHGNYSYAKGSLFIYSTLACVALVLAKIFEKAVKMKEENDLTI